MNKVHLFLGGIAVAALITSCAKDPYPGYSQAESGLYFNVHEDSAGSTPVVGDYVFLHFNYRTMDDSVFFSSYEMGRPMVIQLPEPEKQGDIYSAIQMLSAGDSASFIFNADTFFANTEGQPLPEALKSGDMFKVGITMLDVKTKDAMMQEQMEMMKTQQEEAMKRGEEEKTIIENYMKEKGLQGETTETGLVYIPVKKGSGTQAEPGKTVRVNYTGMLLDGTVFDTSDEKTAQAAGVFNPQRPYEPIEFTLGQGQVIPGWEQGIGMMKTGGKAKFIIPSSLAYGAQGGGPIPPNSVLVFEVELVEVK